MVKMIMHGCNGRMGHVIVDLCKEDQDIQVVAGVDAFGENTYDFPHTIHILHGFYMYSQKTYFHGIVFYVPFSYFLTYLTTYQTSYSITKFYYLVIKTYIGIIRYILMPMSKIPFLIFYFVLNLIEIRFCY